MSFTDVLLMMFGAVLIENFIFAKSIFINHHFFISKWC